MEESFLALAARVAESKEHGKEVVCSLMLDEMAIRKHIEWDGMKFVGFVDIGARTDDDSNPVATEYRGISSYGSMLKR